jgi:hypothetical protein
VVAAIDQFRGIGPCRPIGPASDPGPERHDFVMTEPFTFGGHLQVGIGVGDEIEEGAFVGLSGDDRGAERFAADEGFGFDIQPEATLLLRFAVACVAMFGEDRTDGAGVIDIDIDLRPLRFLCDRDRATGELAKSDPKRERYEEEAEGVRRPVQGARVQGAGVPNGKGSIGA